MQGTKEEQIARAQAKLIADLNPSDQDYEE